MASQCAGGSSAFRPPEPGALQDGASRAIGKQKRALAISPTKVRPLYLAFLIGVEDLAGMPPLLCCELTLKKVHLLGVPLV